MAAGVENQTAWHAMCGEVNMARAEAAEKSWHTLAWYFPLAIAGAAAFGIGLYALHKRVNG